MNLLLLAKSTSAHAVGGMETHVDAVAHAARALGHEVVLITTAHPRGLSGEELDGVRVEYLAGTPPARDSRAWWQASAAAVRRWLDRGFGDLLLSFSLAGYGAAALGPPHYAFAYGETLFHLVSHWHDARGVRGLAAYPKRALVTMSLALLERRLWRRLTGVIATYDELYDRLRRRGYRAHLSYNGIDVAAFGPDARRREATRAALGIAPAARVILMVGTVNRQKGIWLGVETVLELRARHPEVHLLVVGDGPDLPRLRARLAGVPGVSLTGSVPHAKIPALCAAGDLFIYPTLRMEGLPLAIVSALAAGLPVVASDRGGIPSAVRTGETGLLVPPGDGRALGLAIERLLEGPALAEAFGKRGRERAETAFDARGLVERLLQELGVRP